MKQVFYTIGRLGEAEQLRLDFSDGISRTVTERIELGFVPLKLPVIDEVPYRIFETLEEYRGWCSENLPRWLGYYPADD
jgi:hypothetical protein